MSNPYRILLVVLAAVVGLSAPAQSKKKKGQSLIQVMRATTVDKDGLAQWNKWEAPACPDCKTSRQTDCHMCRDLEGELAKCLECAGAKKSPCRTCAGTGHIPDPLKSWICPSCFGASVFRCFGCHGKGVHMVKGAPKPAKCMPCSGKGTFPCAVCKGKRLVKAPPIKPTLAKASTKKLKAARKKVAAVFEALKSFEPDGQKDRKSVKAYQKLLKPALRTMPALKRCQTMAKNLMKWHGKGDVWVGNDEKKYAVFKRFVTFNKYYLEQQVKLLDLCIARAEHNDKVIAEKKNKE